MEVKQNQQLKTYEVIFRVDGRVVVSVDAEGKIDAEMKAEQFMVDADFGPLEDIQWKQHGDIVEV